MDNSLNIYLDKVDRYLRPMSASERADIINEIKSEMVELEMVGHLSPEQITERLGSPKALAGAYLGKSISESTKFSFKKLGAVVAFYSFAGAGSLFVLPFTSVFGIGLMVSGVIAPISGLIKLFGHMLGVEVPWVSFQFGAYTPNPYVTFFLSVVMGVLLGAAGVALWKFSIKFIRKISEYKFKIVN